MQSSCGSLSACTLTLGLRHSLPLALLCVPSANDFHQPRRGLMFRGKLETKEALTQELREICLTARGLASRLELLTPHLIAVEDGLIVKTLVTTFDRAATQLTQAYNRG